ncbi:hypothetical protein HOLleu_44811 [Holothuria leucospilota]|uniref:Uncharacterized protein n=1 Tax=Holothuria leucospilota TaxID=206669 RepID=A0A9Q0YA24_HOLLE|nr:hypothetical protein HOLleu_44811 [Holothuria leucospilota]
MLTQLNLSSCCAYCHLSIMEGKAPKIPVKEAINFLIQFEKSGSSVDAFLEKNKQKKVIMQPYLLGLGESRKNITQYFIIIDHLALPCSAHDAVGAFDTLQKSLCVWPSL